MIHHQENSPFGTSKRFSPPTQFEKFSFRTPKRFAFLPPNQFLSAKATPPRYLYLGGVGQGRLNEVLTVSIGAPDLQRGLNLLSNTWGVALKNLTCPC
ncbi:hypothetical protein TNCV_178981 [Trichonephila clavipes]|nr:hypothetical protein TNCV_178981 [Trichonephila clavipes]